MRMQCQDNMSALNVPQQKKKLLPHIDDVRIVDGELHSSPWLTPMIRLMETWLAYLQKSKIDIFTYITTYLLSGVRVFNDAQTALHTLQERTHVLR
jgi:hypothetical protein